eukprot:7382258-Prymnesium_polylepis.3
MGHDSTLGAWQGSREREHHNGSKLLSISPATPLRSLHLLRLDLAAGRAAPARGAARPSERAARSAWASCEAAGSTHVKRPTAEAHYGEGSRPHHLLRSSSALKLWSRR